MAREGRQSTKVDINKVGVSHHVRCEIRAQSDWRLIGEGRNPVIIVPVAKVALGVRVKGNVRPLHYRHKNYNGRFVGNPADYPGWWFEPPTIAQKGAARIHSVAEANSITARESGAGCALGCGRDRNRHFYRARSSLYLILLSLPVTALNEKRLTENGHSTCWPWTPSDGSLLFLPRFDDRDCLSADVLSSVRAEQLWFG